MTTMPVSSIPAHPLLVLLLQLGLLLLLALVLGRLAVRLNMPAIVGELCAGVVVGPSLFGHALPAVSGWLFPHQQVQMNLLDAIGQFGLLLFVGITGAELELGLLRRRGLTAVRVGVAALVVPLALGVGIGLVLQRWFLPAGANPLAFALFLGVAMGVSAIPVIAKTLLDLKLLHREIGQLILVAGVLDDLVGWILLSIVSAMAATRVTGGAVAFSVLYPLVVGAPAVFLGRPLIRWVLRAAARSKEPAVTVAAVTVLILLSSAGAQALGLEPVLGAFVCGVLIGTSGCWDRERLEPLRSLVAAVLAPLFFAMAGLRMDLSALSDPAVLLAGCAVLAVAVLGKFAGAFLGARLSRLGRWEALALGAGLNSRGVIEVVVAMTGVRLGVLSGSMYTVVVLVAIVTSLMAPPVLRMAVRRADEVAETELDLYLVAP